MALTDCGFCVLLANCDAQISNAWDFYTFASKMLCEIAENTGGLGPSEDVNVVEFGGIAVDVTTNGQLVIQPYADPGDRFFGTTAADIVDTTSTQVVAAGAGTYNITSLTISNLSAAVATRVDILDGASRIWQGPAASGGGGYTISFPAPLTCSPATAINAQCSVTGAQVQVSAAGYES